VADTVQEYLIVERAFKNLVSLNARVVKLWTGAAWAEGPVYFRDGDFLLFSDIPNNRMMRFVPDHSGLGGAVGVFRQPSNNTNGHTRDREGRLVSCEHGARRVTRTEPDGRVTILADSFRGKRLNSPNDVVVRSDGTVWFTDPSYGILSDLEGWRAEPEYPRQQWHDLEPLLRSEVVAPPIGAVYPLDEAAAALRELDERRAAGRVLLRVQEPSGRTG
jgi:gluconolactonase